MEYFSKLNNFATHPAVMKDFSIEQLQFILDSTILYTYSFLIEEGVFKRPSVRGYLSCAYGYNEDRLVIGITDDKTVPGSSFLFSVKKESCEGKTANEIEDLIRETGEFELGLEVKWFTDFSFGNIFSNDLIWEEILMKEKSLDAHQMMNGNHKYELFVMELQKASKKLADTILKKERSLMKYNPIFKARDLTVDENMVFCVLPFNDTRLEIFDEVLKPKLEEEFGLTVVRSGNIFEPNQNLTETIWTYINQSKFVLADISDKNANVFYELGICHTIGKPVISLCDEESLQQDYEGRLPFDVGAINTIFYKNKGNGMEKLFGDIKLNIQSIIEGKPIIK